MQVVCVNWKRRLGRYDLRVVWIDIKLILLLKLGFLCLISMLVTLRVIVVISAFKVAKHKTPKSLK